ncbi:MAG: pyridoxal phosphate-dependent aminotransferase, partial [Bacteroidota bacterium]
MLSVNPNVAAVSPSKTMAMSAKAKTMKRAGHPVIELSAGEPDFPTPAPIVEAGIQALRDGYTTYTQNPGLPELREAIVAKLKQDNGLDYTPAQIVCSNGAKQSVAQAIMVLTRPGDEVIIPAPYWVSYPEMVHLAGGQPITIPTNASSEYKMTPDQLEASITDRTRLLILCSPSNPTGSVYTASELQALSDVLRRHPDVYVLSDEIYEKVIFDAEHISFASFPGFLSRTVTINGFSKAYAMTGWRLGYFAAPTEIAQQAAKVQSQFTSAPNHMTQRAGLAALAMDDSELAPMIAAFRSRRDHVLSELLAIDGVRCPKPEGAFYLFPDVSAFYGKTAPNGMVIRGSEDLCTYLLERHYVALVPGDAFGSPPGVRLSYAASMENLQ